MLELDRIPTHTIATHPGEILRSEFLVPLAISQAQLAKDLEVSGQRINDLVNGHRGITTDTAVLLSARFKTSVGFWMNLQYAYEISKRCVEDPEFLKKVRKIKTRATKQDHSLAA